MLIRFIISALVVSVLLSTCALAAITANDVVVIYNSNTDPVFAASSAVADYYCSVRGIPAANKLGVDCPVVDLLSGRPSEQMTPDQFRTYILNDQGSNPGLLSKLRSLAGVGGEQTPDLATDPTRCLVLCTGIPILISGRCGVDASLSLLFNETPWGHMSLAGYPTSPSADRTFFNNPYYEGQVDPAARAKPADFGAFRASEHNHTTETAPTFSIVRFLDATHAVAAGQRGVLYHGVLSQGSWDWNPVKDVNKAFHIHKVTDISVVSGSTAYAASECGGVIKTTNAGETWTLVRSPQSDYYYPQITVGVSFRATGEGWLVGKWCDDGDYPMPYYVLRYPGWSSAWGTGENALPSEFQPKGVAAVDSTHAWVSGNSGIWYTANGGANWTQVYSTGAVGDIWASGNTGWAIAASGQILYYDGSNWSQAPSSPTLTTGQAAVADLAVCNATHIAIAYSAASFITYDGSAWTTHTTSGVTNASVAWDGGTTFVAAKSGTSVICTGTGSPTTWSETTPISNYDWKLRYLVMRLDGRSDDLDEDGLPDDIKAMIDGSVASDGTREAMADGKFVFDDAPPAPEQVHREFSEPFENVLRRMVDPNDPHSERADELVNRIDSPDPYYNSYGHDFTSVAAYCSSGVYDGSAHASVAFWRPNNHFLPGSIGMYRSISGDAFWRALRQHGVFWNIGRDTKAENLVAGKLRVYMPRTEPIYEDFWIGLHSSDGTLLERCDPEVNFHPIVNLVTVFDHGLSRNVRVVDIDLTSVDWPDGDETYVAVHYPDDDPRYPNGIVDHFPDTANLDIYNARSTGITYDFHTGQSVVTELINEGACGSIGCIVEPASGGREYEPPEIIIPQYAAGRTWAESAWMGIPFLPWMHVVFGDPLMAAFHAHPTVEFLPPSPAEDAHVTGSVCLNTSAEPDGNGAIDRVEFWVEDSEENRTLIASDSTAPYQVFWDALQLAGENRAFADGDYTLEAVVYQRDAVGTRTASVPVVLDSAGMATVEITEPSTDGGIVTASAPVEATAGGSPTKVEFWLFCDDTPALLLEDTTAPYECTVPTSYADGIYRVQAIAYYGATPDASYAARRRISFLDDHPAFASVADLAAISDGTSLYLADVPTVAATTSTMDGAFYVEDSSRASGIRVETAESVSAGRLVTIQGTLHKTSVVERYIEAGAVWDCGPADPPGPLGMPNLSLGGEAPSGTPGIAGGVGLYNLGLLARTWGKVTYVGNDFFYLDDGSGLQDGNVLDGPIVVPLNGDAIPAQHPPVVGIRVYCAGLTKPGIDDYVSVTGISSVTTIGSNNVRYLRPRSQGDLAYSRRYTPALKTLAGLLDPDGEPMGPGSAVRLIDDQVADVYQDYVVLYEMGWGLHPQYAITPAQTQLQSGSTITVCGMLTMYGFMGHLPAVAPDAVYLGGSAFGAMSVQPSSTSGGGVFRPWPYTNAEDIISSPRFQQADNAPGAIGWALSQPDGSVIDLLAERFVSVADGGATLGLAEWFEPFTGTPRLVLSLGSPITGLQPGVSTLDIRGGVLTTLPNGQRALVRPESVFLYVDEKGRSIPPFPFKLAGDVSPWPWKTQVAP